MTKKIWSYVFVGLSVSGFLLFKFSNLYFRFGDGNAYIYMAQAILAGDMPYSDSFFLLFLLPFKLIFGNHLIWFQILPAILESGTAILLFLILRNRSNKFAFLAPAIYLFSFTVASTSDFLTGLQLAVFLMVTAIFANERRRPVISGFLWTASFLTKLYILPAYLGFIIYLYLRGERCDLKKIMIGMGIGLGLIMLPFFLASPQKVFDYMVMHQFSRPKGLNKVDVFGFFLAREWLLITLGIVGAYFLRRSYLFYSWILTLAFFIFFKDIYYLYLGSLMPYLVLFSLILIDKFWSLVNWTRNLVKVVLVLLIIFVPHAFVGYAKDFSTRGRFTNLYEIGDYVRTLPDALPLYGSHEVAPLIALASGRELFGNFIDTNAQAFGSGAQDLSAVSGALAEAGGYMVGRVSHYPEFGIFDGGYGGYFSEEIFQKYCQRVKEFADTGNEISNQIVIYRCKK
ncbi:MAG: hypothetical protein UT69_C0013G0024 [Candidatus Yanofskybacteria bacterium GW2011_GWE1_40_10]|nr:MAG: hypothetical protein UT69_C0013G0024 [Candidatus Yanofskybacteria bacterium GW2011_GWE1_40_10]